MPVISKDRGGCAADLAIPAEWLGLAPLDLPNLRPERYAGETLGVSLGTFAEPDEAIIHRVYGQLNGLLNVLAAPSTPRITSRALHKFLDSEDFDHLRADLRALGHATFAGGAPNPMTAKAIHDIRGGALGVLLLRLELAGTRTFSKNELRTLFTLTRDHGKIMRSAVNDLDLIARKKDFAPQSHHVRLLIEKWHEATIKPGTGRQEIQLFVDSRFDGAVTECCLESAAIDRVFYNLLANALRHNASDRLDLLIFEIPSAPGENLRFVLRNAVNEDDVKHLLTLGGGDAHSDDLGRLFQPGVSSTGSGLGLAIVADFVTQAFGIANEQEALRLGYFGAHLLEGVFAVWFHWPIARGGLGTRATSDAAEEVPPELQNPEGAPPV